MGVGVEVSWGGGEGEFFTGVFGSDRGDGIPVLASA